MSRREAEEGLVGLLNRALSAIPKVKLDKLERVTELFEEAFDYMRTCIEEGQTEGGDEDFGTPSHSQLLGTLQDAALNNRPVKRDHSAKFQPRPLDRQRIRRDTLTEDYASPGLGTRRLGQGSKGGSTRPTRSSRAQKFAAALSDSDDDLPPFGCENPPPDNNDHHLSQGTSNTSGNMTSDYSSPSLSTRRLAQRNTKSSRNDNVSDDDEFIDDSPKPKHRDRDFFPEDKDVSELPAQPQQSPGPQHTSRSRRMLLDLAASERQKEQKETSGVYQSPIFKRPLDDPTKTRLAAHSKLRQAQEKLQKMITEALGKVSSVPLGSMDQIKRRIRQAVEILEAEATGI